MINTNLRLYLAAGQAGSLSIPVVADAGVRVRAAVAVQAS